VASIRNGKTGTHTHHYGKQTVHRNGNPHYGKRRRAGRPPDTTSRLPRASAGHIPKTQNPNNPLQKSIGRRSLPQVARHRFPDSVRSRRARNNSPETGRLNGRCTPLLTRKRNASFGTGSHRTGMQHEYQARRPPRPLCAAQKNQSDRKSTRLNSSHVSISYAVFCLKKKNS